MYFSVFRVESIHAFHKHYLRTVLQQFPMTVIELHCNCVVTHPYSYQQKWGKEDCYSGCQCQLQELLPLITAGTEWMSVIVIENH